MWAPSSCIGNAELLGRLLKEDGVSRYAKMVPGKDCTAYQDLAMGGGVGVAQVTVRQLLCGL